MDDNIKENEEHKEEIINKVTNIIKLINHQKNRTENIISDGKRKKN